MLGLLVAILVGVGVGLARRGSFSRLESARLRQLPILFIAVAVQLGGALFQRSAGGRPAFVLIVVSYAAVFLFALANRTLIGMPLIAAGSFGNFLVIVVNGGMPVSLHALRLAGLSNPFQGKTNVLFRGAHHAMTPDSHLTFLADIIPLRIGATVISVGDIMIWAGLVLLLQHLMVGPRGRHRPAVQNPH
jgi:hypothetical protein